MYSIFRNKKKIPCLGNTIESLIIRVYLSKLLNFFFLTNIKVTQFVCRFAAALKDLPVWVFNVVNTDAPDTLAVIYERGLIGIYHDWCESFSTYPRTYDLLHADHLFSILKNR